MARAQDIAFVLALAACNSSRPAPKSEPAPVVAEPKPIDAAAPARVPSLAEIFGSAPIADGQTVDATALGDVRVLLAYRIGGAAEGDRLVERSLLITGASSIRVPLSAGRIADRGQPFGAIVTADPHAGLPLLPPTGDVVTTLTTRDASGNRVAYMVTRESDALVLWSEAEIPGEYTPEAWTRMVTIALAAGAKATAGDAPADLSPLPNTVEVELREALTSEYQDQRHYDVALRVGDRVGALTGESVTCDDDERWGDDGPSTDLPAAGAVLASRRYGDVDLMVGRAGDLVVAWRREHGLAWVEIARVPLRPGAEVTLAPLPVSPPPRPRVDDAPRKFKPIEPVQPVKRVEKDPEPVEEYDDDDGDEAGEAVGGMVGGPWVPPPPPPPP